MLEVKRGTKIENPRAYESGAVEHLRNLLEIGTPMQRDPRREHFYDLGSDSETYYLHVSPVSGNVVLLARWYRQPQDCCFTTERLVA
jgi:hypothetical protein